MKQLEKIRGGAKLNTPVGGWGGWVHPSNYLTSNLLEGSRQLFVLNLQWFWTQPTGETPSLGI